MHTFYGPNIFQRPQSKQFNFYVKIYPFRRPIVGQLYPKRSWFEQTWVALPKEASTQGTPLWNKSLRRGLQSTTGISMYKSDKIRRYGCFIKDKRTLQNSRCQPDWSQSEGSSGVESIFRIANKLQNVCSRVIAYTFGI